METTPLLNALFPAGHRVMVSPEGLVTGSGRTRRQTEVVVLGTTGGVPLGVEAALALSAHLRWALRERPSAPVLSLVDTAGQRLSRRDEMLGLNEYLAHLAKGVVLAGQRGHRTLALVTGRAVAAAFIALGLSAQELYALPGAVPAVMDLPSVARVTKIPLERLQELSRDTAVLAPGLDNFVRTGGIAAVWEGDLADHLEAALARPGPEADRRDALGAERGGRPRAAAVARRVETGG